MALQLKKNLYLLKEPNAMKRIIVIYILFLFPFWAYGQVLLETLDGDEFSSNITDLKNSIILGSVNSSEQSLQFKTLFVLPNGTGILPTRIITFGIKGKPSDGIFTLFSGSNFNPSTNLNVSFSKVYLFAKKEEDKSHFIDFFSIRGDYNINKLTLFNSDTLFENQVNNFNFEGIVLSFTYNVLFSGKNLFTVAIGYAQKNNYSKLESVEIKDFNTIIDSVSGTTRQYGKTVNGKTGNYKEYESFPIRLAYTYCPSEVDSDKDNLKFGFSLYYSNEFGKNKPLHNLGSLFFLTKQNEKSGIRTPIIGLGIQANDISDNMNKGNKLTKRISFNLTTTLNINSFEK
jgi:hypothetical protein